MNFEVEFWLESAAELMRISEELDQGCWFCKQRMQSVISYEMPQRRKPSS
ncbi:MAG: hypothetical protein LW870_00720 [Pirellula sp.]|nr:hypothetical protein [Pirellula sp.]